MLIVGRRTNQKIVIDGNIEITILEIGRNRVRFGIEAPKEVAIHTKLKELPAPAQDLEEEKTPEVRTMSARGSAGKG